MATVAGKAVVPFQGEFSALTSGASKAASQVGDGFRKSLIAPVVLVGAAFLGIAGVATKMTGDFQKSTIQLVTSAGEAAGSLEMVRQGLLSLAGQVGQTPEALAAGMYQVESAGYHGAQGLMVLKAAAQGAAAEGANMETVASAVTSGLNAYGLSAGKATYVTDVLIATVGSGKMRMEDLSAAIGGVLAPAAAVGVSLPEVGAAIATMTMQGTDAATATTYLRQTLINLAAEKAKGVAALKEIGLNAANVSKGLKTPDGLIHQITLISEGLAKKFPASAALAKQQFGLVKSGAETADQALANLSKNGGAGYINALRDISGGSKTMMGLLELTGTHVGQLQANFEHISASTAHATGAVAGFALASTGFNFQMNQAKAGMDAFMIRLGGVLLPILTSVVGYFSQNVLPALNKFATWFIAVGLPVLKIWGAWLVTNVIVPLIHIGSVAIPLILGALVTLYKAGVTTFETLKKWGLLIPIIGTVVAAFLAFKIAMGIQALIAGVGAAIGLFQAGLGGLEVSELAASTTSYALGAAVTFMLGPWGLAIIAITAVIAIGLLLITHWQQVSAIAKTVFKDVVGFFVALPGRILDAIKSAGTWLVTEGPKLLGGLLLGLVGFLPTFLKWWYVDMPLWILGKLAGIGLWLVERGGALLLGLLAGLVGALPGIGKWLLELPFWILAQVIGAGVWLLKTGTSMIAGLIVGLIGAAPTITKWFKGLPGMILGLVVKAASWLLGIGGQIVSGLLGGITGGGPKLWSWFTGLPAAALAAIISIGGKAGTWLLQIGNDIINGLKDGLVNAWKGVVNWFKGIPGDIAGFFKNALGIHSPSTVFAEIGTNIVQGLGQGMHSEMPSVMSSSPLNIAGAAGGGGGTRGGGDISIVNNYELNGGDEAMLAKMDAIVQRNNAQIVALAAARRAA